eukprot:754949-Hanusia_phi.AAC.1
MVMIELYRSTVQLLLSPNYLPGLISKFDNKGFGTVELRPAPGVAREPRSRSLQAESEPRRDSECQAHLSGTRDSGLGTWDQLEVSPGSEVQRAGDGAPAGRARFAQLPLRQSAGGARTYRTIISVVSENVNAAASHSQRLHDLLCLSLFHAS